MKEDCQLPSNGGWKRYRNVFKKAQEDKATTLPPIY